MEAGKLRQARLRVRPLPPETMNRPLKTSKNAFRLPTTDARLQHMTSPIDLSVLIPVLNERDNLVALLPRLHGVLAHPGCTSEVVGKRT